MDERFARNIALFGAEGQQRLLETSVAVVGVGGLGSHVVQQLAFLGVGHLTLVEPEELDTTNRNRYIGSRWDDPIPGTQKVDIAERSIRTIDPAVSILKVPYSLLTEQAFAAVRQCQWVFGCLDDDAIRLVLTELCLAYRLRLVDLASDVDRDPDSGVIHDYGGRVCVCQDGSGCLMCMGTIDSREAARRFEDDDAQRDRENIYGVEKSVLDGTGPSVVSINGVIASLGVTEFVVAVTGLRQPQRHLEYHGQTGKATVSQDPPVADCWYCRSVFGAGASAEVERYLAARCSRFSRRS
jgi:hypothetical protein